MPTAGSPIEHTVLDVNGLHFDALAAGPNAGELVLFLHGFPQFADAWSSILQTIADSGYRAVAVNQRGYSTGAQPPLVEDYVIENLVSDALNFATALKAERFHLVGHDWGGAVAWRLAADHPRRLHSLTVLSTPNLNAFADALQNDPVQQGKSSYFQLFRAPNHAAEKALLADNAKILRGACVGEVPAAEVESNVRRFSTGDTLTCALNWYRATNMDWSDSRLPNITVPTLYIWGDQDQALGETAALATAKYVTGPYRFERLKGKSHWLLEDSPDEVVALLRTHLKPPPAS